MTYAHVTIRVPQKILVQVRDLAKFSGWQLADLQRTLICIGAAFYFLSYKNKPAEKAASTLMDGIKLLRLSTSFSLLPSKRRYALRLTYRSTTLTTLNLPQSLRDLVATYAQIRRVSNNQVYNKCMQQGLLIYLKAQASILESAPNRIDNRLPLNSTRPTDKESDRSDVK